MEAVATVAGAAAAAEAALRSPEEKGRLQVANVKMMCSFWEGQLKAQEEERSTRVELQRPRRSSSGPVVQRSGAGSARMQRWMARLQSQMAEGQHLVQELTRRVWGSCPPLQGAETSGSESEGQEEEQPESEEAKLSKVFLSSTRAMWRVQRKTIQLLLHHLDQSPPSSLDCNASTGSPGPHAAGAFPCGPVPELHVSSPEASETLGASCRSTWTSPGCTAEAWGGDLNSRH